ncbi:DUF3750 domain-containing protein [Terrihabitans sp. B22-R8]|uniref:DUF3750 domain-containing protein n=1 Tax=Terrihabitans sp. B22-R8 TaxID=3425128 RepID=UPI00403C562B
MKRVILLFLILFILPLATHAAWWWNKGWPDSWSSADWSSARLLPQASDEPDAVVHVLGARTGGWKGIFAHHSWVVIKESGAPRYTRFDVVGWGSPVRTNVRVVDGNWYGNAPVVLLTLRGAEAEAVIDRVKSAIADYPFAGLGTYKAWPGPNSNTFVAHIASHVPELAPALLPTAVGKDYRGRFFAGSAPSGGGLQVSLGGMAGLTFGWVEGVELNVLGAVAGVDFRRPAIKLPGWGRIGLSPA